ncbi:hypothetical protein BVY01_01030, partial [bacterium I07]
MTISMNRPISIVAEFSRHDISSPQIIMMEPAPNTSHVPRNSPIRFRIKDELFGTGIHLSALQVEVNGESVIVDGQVQTQNEASIHEVGDEYGIEYAPFDSYLPNSSVSVHLFCQDLASPPNPTDTVYQFKTGVTQAVLSLRQRIDEDGGIVIDNSTKIQIDIPEKSIMFPPMDITIS